MHILMLPDIIIQMLAQSTEVSGVGGFKSLDLGKEKGGPSKMCVWTESLTTNHYYKLVLKPQQL
ncbi:MAG: hypothetical protein ATN33_01975 [Epulopiscium sp. Nele67-Bin001]|nr:MAG: hypothetical protein ATN33_01975 [Epulopiscium sp. Nele67-Bin001]